MMDKRIIDVATEDRFAVLEKKMSDVEAHVKGLTQELVDLKSSAKKMSRQLEERTRQDVRSGQPEGKVLPPGSGTVLMRKGSQKPYPPAEPVMENILQDDGTIEKELRRGDKKPIVASPGFERNKRTTVRAKQSDLIIAIEREKEDPAKK